MASVLFDLGSTYAYISVKFSLGHDLIRDIFDALIDVSTPVEEFVVVAHVYHTCSVMFVSCQT